MIQKTTEPMISRASIESRLTGLRDERGVALMSAMLFMILLTGMSLVLLSVILAQVGPSYTAQKATRTIYTAQAGLQAALGVVRTSAAAPVGGVVFGAPSKLPCSVVGNLDGSSDDLKYTVSVRYYTSDPTGKDENWLATTATRLPCSATMGVTGEPKFAYLVSAGGGAAAPGRAADEGNRSIGAVYKFKLTNVNIPGGRITSGTECLQAWPVTSGGPIVVGSKIRFVSAANCSDANKAAQMWTYDSSYQIKLASSLETGPALCITGRTMAEKDTIDATLTECLTGDARYTQLWSWTGDYTWKGQNNPISSGERAVFLGRGGSPAVLQAANGDSVDFEPSAGVGAGAAKKETNQVVNYKEFGRCIDMTNGDTGYAFLILYPCKQDPSGSPNGVYWNHQFTYTEPPAGQTILADQQIYVLKDRKAAERFCLQTPSSGTLVVARACTDKSTTEPQKWTRTGLTSEYSSSYLIKNKAGQCLTADTSQGLYRGWSKLTVRTCDGLAWQKWNAPPDNDAATFGSFKEIG